MAKANPTADEIHDERFTVKETLLEEYARLFAPAAAVDDTDYSWSNYLSLAKGDNPAEDAEAQRQWLKRHERELSKHPRSAICLSGGGVRSAAFCLGALQALANE